MHIVLKMTCKSGKRVNNDIEWCGILRKLVMADLVMIAGDGRYPCQKFGHRWEDPGRETT